MKWRGLLFSMVTTGFLVSCSLAVPAAPEPDQVLGEQQIESPLPKDKLRILSVIRLPRVTHKGHAMVELSGLAWSEDEGILYALSDHGVVFHLAPVFMKDVLSGVRLVNAFALRDKNDQPQSWPQQDSEGLALVNSENGVNGDDELIISYELRPRVQKHTPSGGFQEQSKLPDILENPANYGWSNHAIESVAIHPEYGLLVTPERPLKNAAPDAVTIYAANGRQWVFPQQEDPAMSVVALETLPDGRLLLLQRRHQFLGTRWRVWLTRLTLQESGVVGETVARLSSDDLSVPIDNFEGLTHYRGNQYFMISDDNEHPLQDTLLVHFEIVQ